mmetsp:Transcript_3332/g.9483  ORF Transcript_3332/g.9483 Transcript_3332/m.9483 type:complete len:150 (-) Transcript_3332:1227-1676(-)
MHHNHHHHDQMPKGSRVLVMIMICFFGLADSESPWPPACSSSEGGHPIPTGNKNYPRTSMPLRLHHRLRDGATPRRNHVRGPSIDSLGALLLLTVSFFFADDYLRSLLGTTAARKVFLLLHCCPRVNTGINDSMRTTTEDDHDSFFAAG